MRAPNWRTTIDAASVYRLRKPTRCTAARTLVTGTPLRLNTAALASATVRAASSGSASTLRITSSVSQSGSASASCRRKAALTLVGKTSSPRAAWSTICEKSFSFSMETL
jgi:hypothetical protein